MSPNMSPEVIEAVREYFKDEEDVCVDCLLFLKELRNEDDNAKRLSHYAEGELESMERCPVCGSKIEWHHYQEPHDELDGCPMEDMYEKYCPECDFPGQMSMDGV